MALSIDADAKRIEASVGDVIPAEEADPFAPTRVSFARLQAGTRAHVEYARVSHDADPEFESEVVVKSELVVEGWTLALNGRVDGIRRTPGSIVVDEVKSVVLSDDAFSVLHPERYPAYLLQLRLYLFLLAHEEEAGSTTEIRGRLVFINLPGGETRSFDVEEEAEKTRAFLVERVRDIVHDWTERQARESRRQALAERLTFPFPERRPHQAEMEEECLRNFDAGECLLVSAPPGLGKTAAALSAALRHALRSNRRVFFVTSKTTQQRIVSTTLGRMADAHEGLTGVVLRAKAKICANDVVFCHPEFCDFARDYPSKVATLGSLDRLLALGVATPDDVFAEGLRARACPFELSLDLSESADVVVGDYNYVFDPSVAIQRTFDEGEHSDLILVIDEAHNLIDRARGYYSPELDSSRVRDLIATVRPRPGRIYRALEKWLESVEGMFGKLLSSIAMSEPLENPADGLPTFAVERFHTRVRRLRNDLEEVLLQYISFRQESGGVEVEDPVLDIAYGFLRFARVMELEGDEFVYLLEPRPDGTALYRILCLDPSRHLAKRLAGFHAVVAMSATLEPEAYYRDLLGFPPERTSSAHYPSPFARENRKILVSPSVVTTYRERDRWYDRVTQTVSDLYHSSGGHWVTYLPSFRYLAEIESRLGRVEGELLVQSRAMSDGDRSEILGRLENTDGTPRLLLAVLGGVFVEGVDLPGDALVGVVIVSPGIPQVNVERQLLSDRFDALYGEGFGYAYLVPGMNRVIQAAGRLVRSESDRGVVVLLDRRFGSPRYSRYFPRDWYEHSPTELVVHNPVEEVAQFFSPVDPALPFSDANGPSVAGNGIIAEE